MSAKIVNGNAIKAEILASLKEEVEKRQIKPVLAIIFVGEDEASQVYINSKKSAAEEVGAQVQVFLFPEDVSQDVLTAKIHELNQDEEVHGVMIQLPLPKNFNAKEVLSQIAPEKDVDHIRSLPDPHTAVADAVTEVLDRNHVLVQGKNAIILGAGLLAGRSIELALKERGAEVVVCDENTEDLSAYTRLADILVTAVGVPGLVTGEMVKEGVVVIDVGTAAELIDGQLKTKGDVDRTSVEPKASLFTPVPGGIGPITVAILIRNLVASTSS
ncbi:MAG: bifunctional 5,10-methylenetetrahydrofolate dehydrogenase/5,10-methenyltetrahydrofolate cyclohydrolase [Patescibacteria group bacterium]|nr:bifunctional 5,10-methylenetetrahydrofolate dehydrogenase/5,10-methenyltetrahydrofolate cyclohydrolase [Patescibacteria group bacterium]